MEVFWSTDTKSNSEELLALESLDNRRLVLIVHLDELDIVGNLALAVLTGQGCDGMFPRLR
jgi:hypothetical protein